MGSNGGLGVILLLAMTGDQYAELHQPGLGRLLGPRLCDRAPQTAELYPWAADNDAYSDWNEPRFRRMLDTISGLPNCLFVTAPDIVGDHYLTLRRFRFWEVEIHGHGLPVAFVAQNGVSVDTVPWNDCQAVFIGGDDTFKLGPDARAIAKATKTRGHWLHIGRVNSLRRMRYAHALGADSIDGTCFSRWSHTHLPNGVRWRQATVDQLFMELG